MQIDACVSAEARFWDKVERSSNCWTWLGAITGAGYGNFWDGERYVGAHRFAYELLVGPIPSGLELDHLCRNRACVKPMHLEPVTRQLNLLRGATTLPAINVAKSVCLSGHPFDEANTRYSDGHRSCRACGRQAKARERTHDREGYNAYMREYKRRRKELVPCG